MYKFSYLLLDVNVMFVCIIQGLCWVSLVWLKRWFSSCWPTSSSTWPFSASVQSQLMVP